MSLDEAAERESDDCCGHECGDQVQYKTLRGGLRRQSCQDTEEARAEFPAHRQHRAGLNDQLEHLAFFIVKIEQAADNDQVAGAGNRKKFGEAFNNAEYEGLERECCIHGATILREGALTSAPYS